MRSLILSEKIHTTQAKAKAVKGLIDQIINQAKSKNTEKLVSQFLANKKVEEKLFKDFVPRLQNRTSGYTSIVKLGRRVGDGAPLVQMQLLLEPELKSVSTKKARGIVQERAKTSPTLKLQTSKASSKVEHGDVKRPKRARRK